MKIPFYQADAFTSNLFGGNPAAVIPLQKWLEDDMMQKIAMENNLSETAFFVPEGDGFHLRWFTPAVEVDLCGHATLASAHVLFEELGYEKDEILFQTKSGRLTVVRENGRLKMNFPAAKQEKVKAPDKLFEALGIKSSVETFLSDDYLIALESQNDVAMLKPDMRLLQEIEARGVIVTAPGDEVDFVSRFFAPQVGIDEDPVTGSAHTKLAQYWSRRLGKDVLKARQISDRGGEISCKMNGERVELLGNAVTFLRGDITIV